MIGRLKWAISPWRDGPDGTRRESRDEHAKRLYSLDQVVGQDFRIRLIQMGNSPRAADGPLGGDVPHRHCGVVTGRLSPRQWTPDLLAMTCH